MEPEQSSARGGRYLAVAVFVVFALVPLLIGLLMDGDERGADDQEFGAALQVARSTTQPAAGPSVGAQPGLGDDFRVTDGPTVTVRGDEMRVYWRTSRPGDSLVMGGADDTVERVLHKSPEPVAEHRLSFPVAGAPVRQLLIMSVAGNGETARVELAIGGNGKWGLLAQE